MGCHVGSVMFIKVSRSSQSFTLLTLNFPPQLGHSTRFGLVILRKSASSTIQEKEDENSLVSTSRTIGLNATHGYFSTFAHLDTSLTQHHTSSSIPVASVFPDPDHDTYKHLTFLLP